MTEEKSEVVRKKGLHKGAQVGILAGAVVVAGGLGFLGGSQYQKAQTPNGSNFPSMQNMTSTQRDQMRQQAGGNGAPSGNVAGRGGVSGSIVSKDDKSMTVKLSDGSTKVVYYSSSTSVSTQSAASANDLAVGKKIQVSGTSNSDNSTTANQIIIVP